MLVFILLALLVFYLRRQKILREKEAMRRILQEHEVGPRAPRLFDGSFVSVVSNEGIRFLAARGASDTQRRVTQSGSDAHPEGDRVKKTPGSGCRRLRYRLQGVSQFVDGTFLCPALLEETFNGFYFF